MIHKIVNAMKTGQYDTKYGPMVKYTVQLEGVDEAVELSQKPDTPAPAQGQELDGAIEDTQYGKKFKKAQGAGGGGFAARGSDPETRRSIERQASIYAGVNATNAWYTLTPQEHQPDFKTYIEKIISAATAFERHLATGTAPEVKEVQEVMPGAEEVKPETDQINLDDVPF